MRLLFSKTFFLGFFFARGSFLRVKPLGAFTLVEVLVVVAIVMVLTSFLMPALNRARESGRGVVCMSNLRQLGLAFELYGEEYGRYPYGQEINIFTGLKNGKASAWHVRLAPFLEKVNYNYAGGFTGQTFVMSCPTALAAGIGVPGAWQYSSNPQLLNTDEISEFNESSCNCTFPRTFRTLSERVFRWIDVLGAPV